MWAFLTGAPAWTCYSLSLSQSRAIEEDGGWGSNLEFQYTFGGVGGVSLRKIVDKCLEIWNVGSTLRA